MSRWSDTLRHLALVASVCLADGANAADLVTRHYRSVEGLPVSSATNTAIDADGFLWVATHDGLARFDGREFTVYDAARHPDMGGNRINSVFRDSRGQIYAQGASGEWLSVSSQGIRRVRPDPADPDARVTHVVADPLCITLRSGLYCADATGMTLRRRYDRALNIRIAVPDQSADWLVAADSRAWHCIGQACAPLQDLPPLPLADQDPSVQTRPFAGDLLLGLSIGLLRISADSAPKWIVYGGDAPITPVQMREEPDGSLLVGTNNGLHRYTAARWEPAWPGSTRNNTPAQSWRDPFGAFWHSAGTALFRERERVLETQGRINSVNFIDDGSVVVTTLRDGLYVAARPRVRLAGSDPALRAGNLYGLAHSPDGSLWMGSLGNGLYRLWPDGRLLNYGRADGLPGENIWGVAVAPDGSVYAAPYRPGLWRFDAETGRFTQLELPAPLAEGQIRALSFDAVGTLWVGGSGGAWQQVDGHWTQRWRAADGVAVHALAHAPDGSVWLGSTDGLWRQQTGATHPVAVHLLGGATVRGLYRARDGAIFAATEGRGLVRIAADDPDGARAVRLGRAEGLPSSSPHALIEDASGNLWVNSNQGIFRISRQGLADYLAGSDRVLSPLTLGLADGLTELEGNGGVQPAVAVDAEGVISFPSQRGVVRIDPAALPIRGVPLRAVIDGIDNDGAPVPLIDGALPRGVRALHLRYNAADLHAGADVRFRYRLRPSNTQWTEAATRREAAFALLGPGDYRFEVIAGNGDGVWAEEPTVLAFRVPPYWYETRAFSVFLVLLGLLAMGGVLRWRLARLRQRAQQLDHQVRLRTGELSEEKRRVELTLTELAQAHEQLARNHELIESANRRLAEQAARLEALDRFRSRLLADVSHELRTPLMLIKLPLSEVIERAHLGESDRQRLQLPLQQTERLAQLVEQLLGLVQAEAGQLPLHVRRLELVVWLRELVDSYAPIATQAAVRLQLHAGVAALPVYADSTHLATIVGNLLGNALKYAPAGSEISVHVDSLEATEKACIRVIDRGPGYPPELAATLFQRFVRAGDQPRAGREGLGIGLALARELVELHGGRIGTRLLPEVGTEFWVELPLGSAHILLTELALESDAPAPEFAAAPTTGGILLVEDHPELAAYLRERLSEHYPVHSVGDAEAALLHLQDTPARLLISDVVLPGMDGVELCRQVKAHAHTAATPVILMSAKASLGDRQHGLAAGAAAWLSKPFEIGQLLAEIQTFWPHAPALPAASDAAPDADPLLVLASENLADAGFGVNEWSERAHLSERQLRRRVTELTGQAPVAWLRHQRLQRVRRLVSEGRCRTLAEAGLASGFDNPSYLYRLYRAQFGAN